MRFAITRTSGSGPDKLPVEGAVWNGEEWTIEIGALDELIDLSRRVDVSVLVSPRGPGSCPEIEIYDDYRE